MNKLVIPPSPNWFESNAAVCAPDNTFVYGCRNDVIVIEPRPQDEPAVIRVLPRKHRDRVGCVAINPGWESKPRLIASSAEDRIVRVWNLDNETLDTHHSGHTTRSDKLVGVTFAGNDRVISVSEAGYIIVWRYASKELTALSNILGNKSKVSCLSTCPHASWLTAFGLKQGVVIVVDLRGTGKIMYRLIGHEVKPVVALSWCPAPYNIFPKKVKSLNNGIKTSKTKEITENCSDTTVKDTNDTDSPLEDLSNNIERAETKFTNAGNVNKDNTNFVEDSNETVEAYDAANCNDKSIVLNDETGGKNLKPEGSKSNELEQVTALNKSETDTADIQINKSENDKDGNSLTELNKEHNTASADEVPEQHIEFGLTQTDNANIDGNDSNNLNNDISLLISTNSAIPLSETLPENSTAALDAEQRTDVTEQTTEAAKEALPDETKENEVELCMAATETGNLETNKEDSGSIEVSTNDIDDNITEFASNENTDDSQTDQPSVLIKEYLLASTVQGGRSIIIWRAGTDGQKQTELYLSSKQRSKKEDKFWIPLCWLKPKSLLSSSLQNELVEWKLDAHSNKASNKSRLIHSDHDDIVFNIVAPFRRYDYIDFEDWRDKNLLNVWTHSKDRVILNTSLSANRDTLALYPTCAGGVFSIVSSPLSPNRFAVVSGDGAIRLWDICRPQFQYISMSYLLEKSRVSCLAWHPLNDVLFAFGTSEGKVALLDSSKSGKKPIYLVQHFYNPIQKLEWGPLNGDKTNLCLYVLSNGKISIYDTSKLLNEPIDTDICGDNSAFSMAWKADYSICAVSTKSGTVILLSLELKLLVTLYLDTKLIKYLIWHNETAADSTGMNCTNWLALSGSELKVYDCSNHISNGTNEETNYQKNIIAEFNEHSGMITCIAWSPHEDGILASAGEDGSVLVMNVKSKTIMYCCRHSTLDCISCVVWSPINSDFIITGNKDSSISIWKLSENLPKERISKRLRKTIVKPALFHDDTLISLPSTEDTVSSETDKVSERTRLGKPVLNSLARLQHEFEVENCQKVFEFICNGSTNDKVDEIDVTQIFGDRQNVSTLLELEKSRMGKNDNGGAYISLWQGNIAEEIKKAISKETLTHWHVSMAPMVSLSFWKDTCKAYAEQLSKRLVKDPAEIASYHLACHQVEDAIESLCSMGRFREALALAKVRLLENDPIINLILERWAKHMTFVGQYHVAAQCYMALNQFEEAAKMLFKRNNPEVLEVAVKLAEKCDNKDLLNAILHKISKTQNGALEDETELLKPLLTRKDLELQLAGVSINDGEDTSQLTSKVEDASESKFQEVVANDEKNHCDNNEMLCDN